MIKKFLFIFVFLFTMSCSEEQAYRLGYEIGSGIVGTLLISSQKVIDGRYYYTTPSCDYRYLDSKYNNLSVFDCIIYNELHYVAFDIGRITFAYLVSK